MHPPRPPAKLAPLMQSSCPPSHFRFLTTARVTPQANRSPHKPRPFLHTFLSLSGLSCTGRNLNAPPSPPLPLSPLQMAPEPTLGSKSADWFTPPLLLDKAHADRPPPALLDPIHCPPSEAGTVARTLGILPQGLFHMLRWNVHTNGLASPTIKMPVNSG